MSQPTLSLDSIFQVISRKSAWTAYLNCLAALGSVIWAGIVWASPVSLLTQEMPDIQNGWDCQTVDGSVRAWVLISGEETTLRVLHEGQIVDYEDGLDFPKSGEIRYEGVAHAQDEDAAWLGIELSTEHSIAPSGTLRRAAKLGLSRRGGAEEVRDLNCVAAR